MTLCPCDGHTPPVLAPIAPGLGRLPRQIGLFGQFRADLLARVRAHDTLRDWRARDSEDFGLMLLEFWAYVCDVTAFYTAEHAQDLFLATARDDESLRRLVALIDHVPRPAVATEAILAALMDGSDVIKAPAGAGFLSDAVDGFPPQVFELSAETSLDPLRNAWTLVPPRDTTYRPDAILIDPATRNMAEGGLILVDAGPAARSVHKVKTLTSETAIDGATYLRLEVEDAALLPPGPLQVADVRLWAFTQNAPVASISGTTARLSGHYPQIRQDDLVLIEDARLDGAAQPEVRSVTSSALGNGTPITTGSGASAVTVPGPPETILTLSSGSAIPAASARLHFGRIRAGRLAAPFMTTVTADDLKLQLPTRSPSPVPNVPGAGELLVKGVADLGLRVPGEMQIDAVTGRGRIVPGAGFAGTGSLRAPVEAFGNVLHVTRGKTVEEMLGSGQGPHVSFQTFKLSKSPLTYLHDPSAPGGRRSTLRLWIDGIEWRETPSLFTAGPTDRVFTVRLDKDGKVVITTGGEGFGLPAPLGVQNVYALYRYGAGETPPGANQIRQVAGPIKGLRRVFNVTPAFGGAPADLPGDIRFNAPATSATFDRAVSANDFAALARDWGALAAVAVTEWVADALREGVVVTAIFNGTAASEDIEALRAHLTARAAEATPIRVVAAEKIAGTLTLSYAVAPDFAPDKVKADLVAAMTDPFTGKLSPRKAEIGGPVFRSAILGRARQVSGIGELLSLNLDGTAMPDRLGLPAHGYFAPDFVAQEVVS